MARIKEDNSPEQLAQEKLRLFCVSLRALYRQLKQLAGPERANVDKTLVKAVRYEQLDKTDSSLTGAVYSADLIEDIKTECIHDINNRLIASGEIVTELTRMYDDTLSCYRDLECSSRRLDWSRSSPILSGSENQKALEYYLQDGFRIIHQLNGLVTRYKLTFNAVELDQAGSIQRFRDCLKISEELDSYLQEYLSFAAFILK